MVLDVVEGIVLGIGTATADVLEMAELPGIRHIIEQLHERRIGGGHRDGHLEVVFAPGKDQVLGGETEAVRSGSARAVIAIRHRIEGRSLARHSSCYLEIPGAGEGFAAFGQHGVIPG